MYPQADKLSCSLQGCWKVRHNRCEVPGPGLGQQPSLSTGEGHSSASCCRCRPTVPGTAWASGSAVGTWGTVLPGKASLISSVRFSTTCSTAASPRFSLGTWGVSSLQNTAGQLGKWHKEKKGQLYHKKRDCRTEPQTATEGE